MIAAIVGNEQVCAQAETSCARMGFRAADEDVRRGPNWFVANQGPDGLWEHGYGAGKGAHALRLWVALAVGRIVRRFYLNTEAG